MTFKFSEGEPQNINSEPVFAPAREVDDRGTWRMRKKQKLCISGADAKDVELPSDHTELRNRALRTAVALMEDKESGAGARVGAVKVILEATAPKPRDFIMQLLDGDEAAFERWLRAELAEIDAKKEPPPAKTRNAA